MENFAKFRTWAFMMLFALLLSLSGYVWTSHTSAEAAAAEAQEKRIEAVETEVKQLREIIIRLDSYIQHQVELNEWFVSEHQRRNQAPYR